MHNQPRRRATSRRQVARRRRPQVQEAATKRRRTRWQWKRVRSFRKPAARILLRPPCRAAASRWKFARIASQTPSQSELRAVKINASHPATDCDCNARAGASAWRNQSVSLPFSPSGCLAGARKSIINAGRIAANLSQYKVRGKFCGLASHRPAWRCGKGVPQSITTRAHQVCG